MLIVKLFDHRKKGINCLRNDIKEKGRLTGENGRKKL